MHLLSLLLTLVTPSFSSPSHCHIGESYFLMAWVELPKEAPEQQQIAPALLELCKKGCFAFCPESGEGLPAGASKEKLAECRRTGSKAICDAFLKSTGDVLEEEEPWDVRCLKTGGVNCFDSSIEPSTMDMGKLIEFKIACEQHVTKACGAIEKFIQGRKKQEKEMCEHSTARGNCKPYVYQLISDGKSEEAIRVAIRVCQKEKEFFECTEMRDVFIKSKNAKDKTLDEKFVSKLKVECKEKKNYSACRAIMSTLSAEGEPTDWKDLIGELCQSSSDPQFQVNVCGPYGKRLLDAKKLEEGKNVITKACRQYPEVASKMLRGATPVQNMPCPYLSFIQAAEHPENHFSHASCKKDGEKKYTDKSGVEVLSLKCKKGLREGVAHFGSSSSEPLPFFFGVMDIPYKKGVVEGRVQMGASIQGVPYHYYALTNGKLEGVVKLKNYRSEYKDGVLHGLNDIPFGNLKNRTYQEGRFLEKEGLYIPQCKQFEQTAKDIQKITEKIGSLCEWKEKTSTVIGKDGTVEKRKIFNKNGSTIQQLKDGAVALEVICRGRNESLVKSYEPTTQEIETFQTPQLPYKRLEFQLKNSVPTGRVKVFQYGMLVYTGVFQAGKLLPLGAQGTTVECLK